MRSIFEQVEPDIVAQYYEGGESILAKVVRSICNVFRVPLGKEPLEYSERSEFEALDEWAYFNDK